MNETIRLRLLRGKPLELSDIGLIEPLTLDEIDLVGYDLYNQYLYNIVADVSDIKTADDADLSQYTYWDILINNMLYADEQYKFNILSSFNMFLKRKTSVKFDEMNKVFAFGKAIIDQDKFEELRNILILQNCVKRHKDENEFKCANDKAEEIKRKIMKGRQSIKTNGEIGFSDLVSVFTANVDGYNLFNVWDLTLYQFNNQFARMQMIEDYDINIRYLLAGAKKEDIDLKHYIRHLDNVK